MLVMQKKIEIGNILKGIVFFKKRKNLVLSLIVSFVLLTVYMCWVFGTSRLEIDIETPHDLALQVYYSDGRYMNERRSKSELISRGHGTYSLTFIEKKIKLLRIDTGSDRNVQLKIFKIRFSKGFTSRELSFNDSASAGIIPEITFHQLKYLGNGNFMTEGNDPFFCFYIKSLPKKRTIPGGTILLVIISVLLIFYLLSLIPGSKRSCDIVKIVAGRVISQADRMLHDYLFWFYAFIVLLLGWGFEIFNFTFTHDDEMFYLFTPQHISIAWAYQERWAMALLSLLVGNPTVPVIPLAITLFCFFLSFCILYYSPKQSDKYYLFPIYAVFPLLFQSFSFSSLNPGIGFAFLFAASAVYLVNKKSKICFIFAMIFALLSYGLYAIFILYIAIAGVYCWLYRGIRHEFYCRFKYLRYIACKYILLAICCFLLNKFILYVCFHVFEIKSVDFIANTYVRPITNYSAWFKLFISEIWQFYSGSRQIFPKAMIFQVHAVVFCLFVIGLSLICRIKKTINKCLCFFGVLFLLFSPFSPNILHQNAGIPLRVVSLLFPLGLVSIFHVSLVLSRPYRYVRAILVGLLVFIGIQYLWNLNQNTYLNYVQNKRDLAVVSKLQERIESVPEFALKSASEKEIPIWIIGSNPYEQLMYHPQMKQYPNWQSESIGISCFSEPRRVVAMLNIFHYPHYTVSTPSSKMISFIESMPMWPLNGSIAFYKDCLIIKLSDHLPGDSGLLNRKLRYRNPYPVNGAEELSVTQTGKMRLLHTYSASALKNPPGQTEGTFSQIDLKKTGRWISFPARKLDVPYVIVEIAAEYDQPDTLNLWGDQNRQFMQFSFNAGSNHLKVRCPSSFLNKNFLIGFGDGRVNKVVLKDIKVFEDAKYTADLIRLNPALNKKKLLEMLHE